MKLPDSHKELRRLFLDADTPVLEELNGSYLVDMLGLWPSFKRFSHRKIIYRKNNKVKGHNVLLGRRWGHFHLEDALCRDAEEVKATLINYNRPENSFPVRRIRDYIRSVAPGVYLGRFYYLLHGNYMRFLGYFSLEQIKEEI
jgi:hypothetical protein